MDSGAQTEYAAFEEKVRRTVYFDNLSPQVTDAVLRTTLNRFGSVINVRFIPNYLELNNIPRCALVEMENAMQAEAIITKMANYPFMLSGMPRTVRARAAEVEMFDDCPIKPGRKILCRWLDPKDPDFKVANTLMQLTRRHAAEASLKLKRPRRSTATTSDKGKGRRTIPDSSESSDSDTAPTPVHRPIARGQSIHQPLASSPPMSPQYVEQVLDTEHPDIGLTSEPRMTREFVGYSVTDEGVKKLPSRKTQKPWNEVLAKKNFNVERYVDPVAFGHKGLLVETLTKRHLSTWLKKGAGYKPSIVRQFYTTARISEENVEMIRAEVGGRIVQITPDDIAYYLGCERPTAAEVEFPHGGYLELSEEKCAEMVCEDLTQWIGPYFTTGNMHPNYAAMNKLLYCNLRARGTDSEVPVESIRLLLEFLSETEMDITLLIFSEIRTFIHTQPRNNMPYPQMITSFALGVGVKSNEPSEWGEGPITPTTIARSIAARSTSRKRVRADPTSVSEPAPDTTVPHAFAPPAIAPTPPAPTSIPATIAPSQPASSSTSTRDLLIQLLEGHRTIMDTLQSQSTQLERQSAQLRVLWRRLDGELLSGADRALFEDPQPTAGADIPHGDDQEFEEAHRQI